MGPADPMSDRHNCSATQDPFMVSDLQSVSSYLPETTYNIIEDHTILPIGNGYWIFISVALIDLGCKMLTVCSHSLMQDLTNFTLMSVDGSPSSVPLYTCVYTAMVSTFTMIHSV